MHTICRLAGAVVATVIISSADSVYSQETKQLPVPNVTVTAPAAPVEPPYLRDPWKSCGRLVPVRSTEDNDFAVPGQDDLNRRLVFLPMLRRPPRATREWACGRFSLASVS
jgi:hypothetical protein